MFRFTQKSYFFGGVSNSHPKLAEKNPGGFGVFSGEKNLGERNLKSL